MTAAQALIRADLTRPNELEPELKLGWLAALDGQIRQTLHLTHEGCAEAAARPVPEDPEAELPVPPPWDELYLRYLVMRIDLENGELERYNADAACFNRAWRDYAAHYVRTHRPLGAAKLNF